jgi:hypothetical protein
LNVIIIDYHCNGQLTTAPTTLTEPTYDHFNHIRPDQSFVKLTPASAALNAFGAIFICFSVISTSTAPNAFGGGVERVRHNPCLHSANLRPRRMGQPMTAATASGPINPSLQAYARFSRAECVRCNLYLF